MLPDRVLNPGPLTYESGAPPIALCGPAYRMVIMKGCKQWDPVYNYSRALAAQTGLAP